MSTLRRFRTRNTYRPENDSMFIWNVAVYDEGEYTGDSYGATSFEDALRISDCLARYGDTTDAWQHYYDRLEQERLAELDPTL